MMQGMAAFTLDLLAQLPEAYQAFSPLIDILPLIPVFFLLLAFVWQARVSGSTSPTIDEVPLVYPRVVMAIGALLLAVQMIARALQNLMSLPPEDAEARRIFGVE